MSFLPFFLRGKFAVGTSEVESKKEREACIGKLTKKPSRCKEKIVDEEYLRKIAERVAARRKVPVERIYGLGGTFIKELTDSFEEGDELPISSFSKSRKNPRAILKKENGKIILRRC